MSEKTRAPAPMPSSEGQTQAALSSRPPHGYDQSPRPSRAPMIVALVALGLLVTAVLAYVVAAIVGYNRDGGVSEGVRAPATTIRR